MYWQGLFGGGDPALPASMANVWWDQSRVRSGAFVGLAWSYSDAQVQSRRCSQVAVAAQMVLVMMAMLNVLPDYRWWLLGGGLVLAALPILLLFLVLQRYVIRGFASGLKG